jgi:hypothetical protein
LGNFKCPPRPSATVRRRTGSELDERIASAHERPTRCTTRASRLTIDVYSSE